MNMQETGLDIDAPFNYVADLFYRKYEESMAAAGEGVF